MKSGLKQRLRCLLASALSLSMAVAAPLTSFATNTGIGGNTGGNASTGVVTSTGGDFGCNINPVTNNTSGRIGVRFSLVDSNDPSKVISVDENGDPMVLDLIYATKQQFWKNTYAAPYGLTLLTPDHIFSSVKTQDTLLTPTNGGPKIKQIYGDASTTYNATVGILKGEGEFNINSMAPWMRYYDNNYHAEGDQFVEWCWQDNNGNTAIVGGDLYTINIFGIHTKVERVVNSGTVSVEIDSVLGKEQFQYPVDNLYGELEKHATSFTSKLDEVPGDLTNWAQTYPDKATELYKEALRIKDIMKAAKDSKHPEYESMLDLYNDKAVDTVINKVPSTFKAGLYKDKMQADGRALSPSTWLEMESENIFNTLKDTVTYNPSSGGSSSSTESSEQTTTSSEVGPSHIAQILGLRDDKGELVLQTESMRQGKATDLQDVIDKDYEDWTLLVEPIMWLTIFPVSDDGTVIENKIYGTVSNIMDAFKYFNNLKPYAYTKTFNWKAMKEAWKALCVEETTLEDGQTKLPGYRFGNGDMLLTPEASGLNTNSYYHPGQLSDKNQWSGSSGGRTKAGFGVNVYWGKGDLGGAPDGRTWDEPTDYPAPPPEEQKIHYGDGDGDGGGSSTTDNSAIKVVKWYVTKLSFDDTIKEVVTDVIVDDDHPRTILCENEGVPGESDFYLLEKWATGKNETLPEDGDTSTTFEKYHKKNPGEQGGLEPALVEVSENDKVLYLKLVNYDFLEKEDIVVIKVKEPADGSTPLTEKSTTSSGTYNAEETGWVYVEDIQTPDPDVPVSKWSDVPKTGTPGSNPQINIPETTKTIYIRYTEDPNKGAQPEGGQIILYSNELSYGYTLRNLTKNNTLAAIQEYFDNHYRGSHRSF